MRFSTQGWRWQDLDFGPFQIGLNWNIKVWWPMYSCEQYDGWWKALRIGPAYITWFKSY